MEIKNRKIMTVTVEVEVMYDSAQYDLADAADEVVELVDNATDEAWDEYMHVKSVKMIGRPR